MASNFAMLIIILNINYITSYSFNFDEMKSMLYAMNIIPSPVLKDEPLGSGVLKMVNKHGQEYVCTLPKIEILEDNQKEEEHVDSAVDISVLLKPMESAPCLVKRIGWWTYEICPGSVIKQYHVEDNKVAGPILVLGKYESDYDWKNNSLSKNRLQKFHVQHYVNGSKCDITGKPRRTEVRFHCEEGVGDYIKQVDEPESCRYIITVATTRVCHHPYLKSTPTRSAHGISCSPVLTKSQMETYNKKRYSVSTDSTNSGDQNPEEDDSEDEESEINIQVVSVPLNNNGEKAGMNSDLRNYLKKRLMNEESSMTLGELEKEFESIDEKAKVLEELEEEAKRLEEEERDSSLEKDSKESEDESVLDEDSETEDFQMLKTLSQLIVNLVTNRFVPEMDIVKFSLWQKISGDVYGMLKLISGEKFISGTSVRDILYAVYGSLTEEEESDFDMLLKNWEKSATDLKELLTRKTLGSSKYRNSFSILLSLISMVDRSSNKMDTSDKKSMGDKGDKNFGIGVGITKTIRSSNSRGNFGASSAGSSVGSSPNPFYHYQKVLGIPMKESLWDSDNFGDLSNFSGFEKLIDSKHKMLENKLKKNLREKGIASKIEVKILTPKYSEEKSPFESLTDEETNLFHDAIINFLTASAEEMKEKEYHKKLEKSYNFFAEDESALPEDESEESPPENESEDLKEL